MSKRLYKRILCLLLALQMLCAPLAQAAEERPETAAPPAPPAQSSQPPAQESPAPATSGEAEKEKPQLEETGDGPLTTAVTQPYEYVVAGYGLSIHQEDSKRWFHLERADGANQDTVNQGTWLTLAQAGDSWKITDLPTEEEVGRLPDMRFGGWYAYKSEQMSTATAYYDPAMVGNFITGDMAISGESTGVDSNLFLNLVGRWLPSDDARALEVAISPTGGAANPPLTLYAGDLAGKTKVELETAMEVAAFDPEDSGKEYYLRVGADVETLDLSFLVQEPYARFAADYAAAGNRVADPEQSPVRVYLTAGGTTVDYTNRLGYEPVKGGEKIEQSGDTYWKADNTTADPAHSRWSVGNIALTPSAGKGHYYNVLQLVVTAPDGVPEHAKTYTFHIQRLTDPSLALKPGNTPLGMVERDKAGLWGATEEQRAANKAAAADYFKANKTFHFAGGYWPSDGVSNNNGRVYHGNYFTMAWVIQNGAQTNYDFDATAVVAYEDRKFQEPGLVLYGSEGDPVAIGAGAGADYEDALERSYTLFCAEKLAPSTVAANSGAPGGEETTTATVRDSGGADVLDLEGKRVRPGVYSIEYCYTDPISGLTYDSKGANFHGGDPAEFSRPLLVMPIPGDVDMDGAVTTADAVALKTLVDSGADGLLSQAAADSSAALYLYRVCDVNRDGAVDLGDVDKLLSGFRPKVSNDATNASDYFYLPLPLGEEPARRSAPTGAEPAEPNKAALTLDYLGKNTSAVTDAPDASGGPAQDLTLDKASGLQVGDVFWVGVRLRDTQFAYGELYRRLITSFTGTLTYDSRYVKPVAVLSDADREALKRNGDLGNEQKEWAYTLRKYNVGFVSNTVWGDVAYELTPGVNKSRDYAAHYSKALTTLGGGGTSALREAVFSITAKGNGTAFNPEGGYLLLVPLQLTNYPFGAVSGSFVELGMGMQDFVFTTDPIMTGRIGGSAGNELTVAWSMQDEIFGGATENAMEAMQYRGGSAVSLKLGEDTTAYQMLYNNNVNGKHAVYGEAFINTGVVPFSSPSYTQLPPGLTYRDNTISGIPTKAGIYTFYIGGKPYQLTVEKAPLTVTAASFTKYYGESPYCGRNAADLTFTYNKEQIKALDLAGGAPNTGAMADLAGLIGADAVNTSYQAPACTAYAAGTAPVNEYTVVGTYPVRAENGLATNYEFHYVDGSLTVKKRPIVVEELTLSTVGTVYHDGLIYLYDLPAHYAPPTTEFTVVGAPKLPSDVEGQYNGLPLTGSLGVLEGDTLDIQYNATYIRTEEDRESGFVFAVPPGATVTRDVTVNKIRLTETGRWSNYDLRSEEPQRQNAKGTVKERSLTSLEIYNFPQANRVYEYGQGLNISGSGLIVLLISGEGQDAKRDYITYSRDAFAAAGVNLTWVTEAQRRAGELGTESAYGAQYLHVNQHNGMYLCVWKQWENPQGETVTVKTYTDGPITVKPKPLTLTVENQKRYYGEENGPLSFRYTVNELAIWDRKPGLTGSMTELDETGAVALLDYEEKPVLTAVTALTGGKAVDRKTPVTNTDCYITISGGKASDYVFRYALNNGAETVETGDRMGWGTLRIHPRPIVVNTVSQTSVGTIYADTYTTSLSAQSLTHSADGSGGNDSYDALVPTKDYYTRRGVAVGADPTRLEMPLTGAAVVEGDTVALTYDAAFVPDNRKQPYFTMGDQGEKEQSVVVRNLTLDREKPISNCYELAFLAAGDAEDGFPATRYDKGNTEASAYGTVRRRPITALRVLTQPMLSYTYGDELSLYGMQLAVVYEDTYENDSVHNKKEVILKLGNNDQVALGNLGLRAYYSDGTNLLDPVDLAGTYPTVKETTGKRLALSGQIPNAPAGVGAVTSNITQALTVQKKAITLTVQEKQFRFYGESNGRYALTVPKNELAKPDQALFAGDKLTGSSVANPGSSAPVVASDLAKLPGYTPSTFQTTAAAGSPVVDGGYELKLTGGGTDNYTYRYVAGRILVLKRPISVVKVTKDPVYTVYPASDAADAADRPKAYSAYGAETNVTTSRAGAAYSDPITVEETHSDSPLPMSDFGLYGADKANFSFTVNFGQFPTDADLGGNTRAPWPVTISGVALNGAVENNYRLIRATPGDSGATARVDKREIASIEVTQAPVLDGYTYGDALDLSALKVKITYAKKEEQPGDETESEEVSYGERDNIYVNYWDADAEGNPLPLPDLSTDAIVKDHPASGGDHLTIAPVHGDPDFSANGKYLIVSARTHKNLPFVAPELVGETAIKVAPLQLTYTLSAENKTYDGTNAAEGTLKLTNAYNRGDVTDVVYIPTGAAYENKGGTADAFSDFVTYVKTNGNGYAFPTGENGLAFRFLYPNVRYADENHNTAVPADLNSEYWNAEQPAKVPGEPGWDVYGPVASMPVEARGMVLAGPDAANYTWKSGDETQRRETEVLRGTRNEAVDGQAAAPYAAIEKAVYDMPGGARPTVEVDRHTNTARMVMPQSLGTDAVSSPYGSERHYEYALDTLILGEGDALAQRVENGTLAHQLGEAGAYQDTRFFGGEPVTVTIPEGYEPEEPPREPGEPEVVKGQRYLWADEDAGFADEEGNALRTPLPRDAFLWGRTRLAETHNYLPSAPRYSIEDDSETAVDSAALLDAVEAAAKRAEAEIEMLTAEAGKRPEKEEKDPAPVPVAAGKSYAQRLDLISTEQKRGADTKEYQVDTLESVWFTDVLQYPKKDVMDAVTRNADPTRYYGYFWDQRHSATLEFEKDKEFLDLSGPIEGVEVERKNEDGTTEKVSITVNEDNIAKLYVSTTSSGGSVIEWSIAITPTRLDVALGSAPVTLKVEFTPKVTTNKSIQWTSSDEKVAKVSKTGVVTFVGVGSAVITATSYFNRTAQITVRVEDPNQWIDPDAGIFDFYKTGAYSLLDGDGAFHPERTMTRGETVVMLYRFVKDNSGWTHSGSGEFSDISGGEYYAEAARELGRLGVITGVHGGSFAAESTITRAEFITLLARMMNVSVPGTKGGQHAFRDSGEEDTWAWAYIDAMAALGVARGSGGENFSPERPITRAEAAVFLDRLMRAQETDGSRQSVAPTDMARQDWAYDAVFRAVNGRTPKQGGSLKK